MQPLPLHQGIKVRPRVAKQPRDSRLRRTVHHFFSRGFRFPLSVSSCTCSLRQGGTCHLSWPCFLNTSVGHAPLTQDLNPTATSFNATDAKQVLIFALSLLRQLGRSPRGPRRGAKQELLGVLASGRAGRCGSQSPGVAFSLWFRLHCWLPCSCPQVLLGIALGAKQRPTG